MNYAELWIGDLMRKTADLPAEEFGVYFRLLLQIYATERPLRDEVESLERIANVHGERERKALSRVLNNTNLNWLREDGLITQKRAAEEIEKRRVYVGLQKQRSALGVAARKFGRPDAHGEVKQTPDAHAEQMVFPAWLDADQFNRWLKIRPAKARTPDAQKAAIGKLEKLRAAGHDGNAIVSESLANGWSGLFKPDPKQSQQSPVNHSPSLQRKPCAYCNAPSIGRVNQIDHCRAHSDAATFHEPLPGGKNDAIPTNT